MIDFYIFVKAMLFPMRVGFCSVSLYYGVVLRDLFTFATILLRKRVVCSSFIVFLHICGWLCYASLPGGPMGWSVIVAFPGHHTFFLY